MRYAAFISYRHSELDMEIAKKVHTGLETYKIPTSVQKKTGKKKIGRVFRDQEELPIGSDLDDNISTALKESEYLIVICSPRTPGSYWVCKEIETFIELHDRNHVLAVLIEGEPNESFPPQLLTDENGNPVEPLAADVRGEDRKERNAKFKTELLRLAAPVIGCTYDDLRQRDRERKVRRLVAIISSIAAVVAIAGTAFGIYNANVAKKMKQLADEKAALADEKIKLADEITVQYKGKQENQSRFYAEESQALLDAGNREDAILVAMQGLPSEGNERPYVADAEYALGKALYAYDDGSFLSFDRILPLDLAILSMHGSDDRSEIIAVDSGSKVYVWDTNDWSLKTSISPALDENTNAFVRVISADADDTGVYVGYDDGMLIKYDYDGNVIFFKKYTDILEYVEACDKPGLVLVACRESIDILDASTGQVKNNLPNTTDQPYSSSNPRYDVENNMFYISHYDTDIPRTYITVLDPEAGTQRDIQLSEGFFLDCYVTQSGNLAVLSCNGDLLVDGVERVVIDLFDPEGNTKWTRELDAHVKYVLTFNSIIKAHTYTENDEEKKDIVVTIESEAFTINEENGEIIKTLMLPGDVTGLAVSTANSFGRVGYRNGGIDFVDFVEGRVYSDYSFETHSGIRNWVVVGEKMVYSTSMSPDIHVIGWHEAPDMEDYTAFDERVIARGVSRDGEYFAISPSDRYTEAELLDKDGKVLYRFDKGEFISRVCLFPEKAYLLDRSNLWVIDPYKASEKKLNLKDYGLEGSSMDVYFTKDGSKGVFWSARDLIVMDMSDESILYHYETDGFIEKAVLSNDGSRAFIIQKNENMFILDTSDGSRVELKDDTFRTVSAGYDQDYLAVSNNGKYVALCCVDGYIRVADTATLDTVAEIPLQSYLRSYVGFTDDDTHLVMQGDDYRIRIWDMEEMAFSSTKEGSGSVEYIVCDEESGLMAVCEGFALFLFETEDYGCVAYADDGVIYLKNNDSILISSDKTNYKRVYYKDYKTLMEEAKKQFPNAELSDEKKVKYNVN